MEFDFNSQMSDLYKKTASYDSTVAAVAQHEFAKAIEIPLRDGIMSGPITSLNGRDLFQAIPVGKAQETYKYPLSFLAPGTEKDYIAYTMPKQGRIPERNIESDELRIPLFGITNSIDWLMEYAELADWNIAGRALEVFEAGFTKKQNDDGWHVILAAVVDRNIVVFDSDSAAGFFSKRVVSLGKTVMRRNGGGNSTSMNRGKLTDIVISPEGIEDMRNWGVDLVDEVTRREIYLAADGSLNKIFGVFLHDMDEFGEGQEYQQYFLNELGGAIHSSDLELAVGLDLSKSDSFIMPVRGGLEVFADTSMHRQRREGYYGWMHYGVGALDNRRCIALSY